MAPDRLAHSSAETRLGRQPAVERPLGKHATTALEQPVAAVMLFDEAFVCQLLDRVGEDADPE